MMSIGDVVRYVPGMTAHQGENNRDQVIIRGNSSSADFFVNGVRDDVQYYRDLYNLERVEALKGPNAMIFGRGGAGGVVNRVIEGSRVHAASRGVAAGRHVRQQARDRRTSTSRSTDTVALRLNGMYRELRQLPRRRRPRALRRQPDGRRSRRATDTKSRSATSTCTTRASPIAASRRFRAGRPTCHIETFYGNPDHSHVRRDVNLGIGRRRAPHRRASRSATARWSATTTASIRTSCRARSPPTSRRWR